MERQETLVDPTQGVPMDPLDDTLRLIRKLHAALCEAHGPRSPQAEASREALAALGHLHEELTEPRRATERSAPALPPTFKLGAPSVDTPLMRGVARVRLNMRARERRRMAAVSNQRVKMFFGNVEEARSFTKREQSMARTLHHLRRLLHED